MTKRRMLALFPLAAILLGAILLSVPMWDGRYFYNHESLADPARVVELHRNLQDGVLLVRWFPDYAFGFGLPQLVYFPPLSLYCAEIFYAVGFSVFTAIKITYVLILILAGWGTYTWIRLFTGTSAALLGAFAAMFAPYHIFNIYVRGDLHEILALALLPITLRSFHQVMRELEWSSVCRASFFYILVILSHNIVALMFTPVLLLYIAMMHGLSDEAGFALRKSFLAMILAYLGSAFYWIPALFEQNYIKLDVMTHGFADYENHFIQIPQLFSWYWGFGASVRGPNDTVSFQIGNIALLLGFIGILAVLFYRREQKGVRRGILFSLTVLVVSVFMMTEWSRFLWRSLPFLKLFQFPYRFLGLATLSSSFLASTVVFASHRRREILVKVWTVVGILALILVNLQNVRVAEYFPQKAGEMTPELVRRLYLTVATGEYVPRWVTDFPPPKGGTFMLSKLPEGGFGREEMETRMQDTIRKNLQPAMIDRGSIAVGGSRAEPQTVRVVRGKAHLYNLHYSSNRLSFVVYAQSRTELRVGTFYFPGWHATANGVSIPVGPEEKTGLIRIVLEPGNYQIRLRFGRTELRLIAELVSGITVVLMLISVLGTLLRHFRRRSGAYQVRSRLIA